MPPTQRKHLYINQDKKYPPNYSPINFFEPDYISHPNFKKVKGKILAELNHGDTLFIPAFWWHHVKSSKNKNIAVSYWYTPDFMFHKFMEAVENQHF